MAQVWTMEYGKSFKSSSSTLAAGLDLMESSVDELVAAALPDDPEEQELLKQLEDRSYFQNLVSTYLNQEVDDC